MSTPQIDFWRGDFGNLYTDRNTASAVLLHSSAALWSEIMAHTLPAPPQSILEVGANLGVNLRALRAITGARLYAVEPNDKARDILLRDQVVAAGDLRGGSASAIDFADGAVDLTFTSGVLIHIHPDQLLGSLKEIYRCSARWIVCIEYFSDKPEMLPYRGHDDRLFKRDFGGYWLDNFSDLRTVAYGFVWKRVTGLDNLTWWLFEKR